MLPVDGAGQQPVILEVIGPAGAGKSSLCLLLARRERDHPHEHLGDTAVASHSGLALHATNPGRPLDAHRSAALGGVQAHGAGAKSPRRLQRMPGSFRLVVLDEGPIFTVTWLLVSGHRRIREGRLEDWWRWRLFEWASDLDFVVALDAADELLAQRIRARPKAHEIKHKSDEEDRCLLCTGFARPSTWW